jgi:hypothetical protein
MFTSSSQLFHEKTYVRPNSKAAGSCSDDVFKNRDRLLTVLNVAAGNFCCRYLSYKKINIGYLR